ncbi:MAG: hypothetical protein Q8N88_06105 [Nanoarchaeota archaeon]|nr:hypothetical protein [Nanoarchaeota archaeon]
MEILENKTVEPNEIDRQDRLKSEDPEIFRQAFKELRASVEYAKKNFRDTAIYRCLQLSLDRYSPGYEKLPLTQSN